MARRYDSITRGKWRGARTSGVSAAGKLHQFSLRQSLADLELQTGIRGDPHPPNTARLYVANAFRRPGPVFLTINSGMHGTAIYANGVLASTAPQFRISTREFAGRLVLGDSPLQPDSWAGQLLGLAIYRRELTASQVLRHYETWTQGQRPEISPEISNDESNVALYVFAERAGSP